MKQHLSRVTLIIALMFLAPAYSSSTSPHAHDWFLNARNAWAPKLRTNAGCDWLIVGAGPAGIAIVGMLLDLGVEAQRITWLDPEFNVGRIGEYYGNVPSNNKTSEFIYFVNACSSFQECTSPALESLRNSDPNHFDNLSVIIEPLQSITQHLLTRVDGIQDSMTSLYFYSDTWHVGTANGTTIEANHVVLATGSHPRTLEFQQSKIIPLDIALDPDNLNSLLTKDDVVGVVGSAHSAILLLKFLSEMPLKYIVNFYRVPIVYAINMGTWTLNAEHGLKGATAEWAKNVLEKNPPANLSRVYTENDDELQRVLEQVNCSHIIYAIGFDRNQLPAINDEQPINSYDTHTGIIGPRLFGIGIAFPEEKINPLGGHAFAVGLYSFMNYIHRQVPGWLDTRTYKQMQAFRKVQDLFNIWLL